jgi:hypothetical protein
MKIPRYFYPHESNIIRFMLWRRQKNMNTILLICGSVRTGKSYDGLVIAEDYCRLSKRPFNVTEQCSFEILPFLKWSKTATDDIYILDEVGNTLNAQDWFEIQSKIMRNFIFAQGFRRNILIIILPNNSSLQKSLRSMVNYIIETVEQGFATWYKQKVRHMTGKILNPYYMGTIRFRLPSPETLKGYEGMKKEWNDTELAEDIEHLEGLKERKYYTMPKELLIKGVSKGLVEDEKFIDDMTSKGFRKTDAELMLKIAKMTNAEYSHHCYQCQNDWTSRTSDPQRCPSCNTRNWKQNQVFNIPA